MRIEEVFVPLVAAVSTALGCWFAARKLRWPAGALGPALGKALECVGAVVLFCLLNAVVGSALIFAARAISGRFVSLHLGADQSLLAVSALQALVFQWWRESSRSRRD
jgi:hypothetical protein